VGHTTKTEAKKAMSDKHTIPPSPPDPHCDCDVCRGIRLHTIIKPPGSGLVPDGHQPTGERLDSSKPPQGGSGVPEKMNPFVSEKPNLPSTSIDVEHAIHGLWEALQAVNLRVQTLERKERQRGVDHE